MVRASQVVRSSAIARDHERSRSTGHAHRPTVASAVPETESAFQYNVNLQEYEGMPMRETLQSLYRAVRDKNIKEAMIFSVFFAAFLLIAFMWYDVHQAFLADASIIDLFLDEEFPDAMYKKNFYEIMTQEEYWQWVEGPLVSGLYSEEWPNGELKSPQSQGYVLNSMRLVGAVRFRQSRVNNASCSDRRFLSVKSASVCDSIIDESYASASSKWPSLICVSDPTKMFMGVDKQPITSRSDCPCGAFDTKDGNCFADVSPYTKAELSSGGEWAGALNGSQRAPWMTGLSTLYGLQSFQPYLGYGGGSYVLDVDGHNRTRALEQLAEMKREFWIDQGTRAVSVDINLYNTYSKLVTVARFTVEFFAPGFVAKNWRTFSFKLVYYLDNVDMFRLAIEMLYFILFCYHVRAEVINIKVALTASIDKTDYLREPRAQFEMLLFFTNMTVMVYWVVFITDDRKGSFDVNRPDYVDLHSTAQNFSSCFNIVGFLGLLYSLKLFKFLSISQRMNALWMTLSAASTDLLFFSIGGLVLVAGFALCGMFLFGHMNIGFHDFVSAMSTLLRFPLGDFDFEGLMEAAPAFAGVYFAGYVAIVFIVVMNLFIGIINKYFDDVHTELQVTDLWKASAMSWTYYQARRVSHFVTRSCSRSGGGAELRKAMANEDHEWQREGIFMEKLRKAMSAAKRERNIDLFVYFKHIYKSEAEPDFLFIDVHELCALTNLVMCPGAVHKPECKARQVVEAYHAMKCTTMPRCLRHRTPESLTQRPGTEGYKCWKVNRSGRMQPRVFVIHASDQRLLNFVEQSAERSQLRKVLPLTQLIQIETSDLAPTTVTLVFTSQGHDDRRGDVQDPRTLDTAYRLVFRGQSRRDQFIKAIQACLDDGVRTAPKTNAGELREVVLQQSALLQRMSQQIQDLMNANGVASSTSPAHAVQRHAAHSHSVAEPMATVSAEPADEDEDDLF